VKFTATLELHGKTATGIEVPEEVVTALGSSQRPAVTVTINGYSYRSTIAKMRGQFLLPLSAENRAGAGAEAGDVLEVGVTLDDQPRVLEVPPDLAAALDKDPRAKAFFETLSYSNKRWHTQQIESAKTDATRERRVAKSIEVLRAGKKP
jgi:hypothetical protein